MTKLALLFSLLTLLGGLYVARIALDQFCKASAYEALYETERNELEATYRTIGRGVDPAFVCRNKVQK